MKSRKILLALNLLSLPFIVTGCEKVYVYSAVYTVTLNTCGGSISLSTRLSGNDGETIDLSNYTPIKYGYSFLGWSTKYIKDTNSGDSESLINNSKFTINKNNATLYAAYSKQSGQEHTQKEVDAYMAQLAETSEKDHLYVHYYRFSNTKEDYNDWDVWCWPYRPKEGEGARFDWVGRTQSSDHLSATGDAVVDNFGGTVADIDLTKTYDGGTSNSGHSIGGTEVSFYSDSEKTKLDTKVGIQIVYSEARKSSASSFGKMMAVTYIFL